MSSSIYLLTLCLPLATVFAIFALRAFSNARLAAAKLAESQGWREVAERAAKAQADTAASLTALTTSLSDMRGRLAAVETILKDVG